MKLILAEPYLLKESINIISELVTEAIVKVNQEGLELKAMDPANVAMVLFHLSKSAFTEYVVPEKVNLALNLDQFKQVLRRAKQNDTLALELHGDSNLQLRLVGDSIRTFSLALLDLEEAEQKTPALKFPLSVDMPTQLLDDALEDMGVVSETVTFVVGKEKLDIQARSNLNSAHVEIQKNSDVEIVLKEENAFKSRYSLEYLRKMIKASKLAKRVRLSFNNEYPIRLDYDIPEKMQISFILAPRTEND